MAQGVPCTMRVEDAYPGISLISREGELKVDEIGGASNLKTCNH